MKTNNSKGSFVRRAGGVASSVMLNIFQRQKQPQQQPIVPASCHYSSTGDTADWMGHLAQHCNRHPSLTL